MKNKQIFDDFNKKSNKLSKIDYIIMMIMILIYGFISFYRLGDFSAPKTYYAFSENNDSITVDLNRDVQISKMRYWTGANIGDITVMISNNGKDYVKLKDFTTYSVLAWEDVDLYVSTSSIKFVGNNGVTLGDIALYDFNGDRIVLGIDKSNPLLDEVDIVPLSKSFMNSTYFDEVYHARCAYEYASGIDCFEWSHPPLGKVIMTLPVLLFGYSPFTVRLMGNLAGILLIPIMYILCKKIFKNSKYAFLGAILMMFDNMHFVHTRIALVDGFEVLFILLSVLFMKKYLDLNKKDSLKKKAINLLLSGLFIGCAISTKWNALYPALALAIVFFIHLAKEFDFNLKDFIKNKVKLHIIIKYLFAFVLIPISLYYLFYLFFGKNFSHVLLIIYIVAICNIILFLFVRILYKNLYLAKLFLICIVSFIILPIIIYILSYVVFPNVSYYDGTISGIIDQTKLMYNYHSSLDATHPFSSNWYAWPVMYKPVWFYSGETVKNLRSTIVDIGNPAIWWFSIVSFVYVLISTIKKNKESLFILIFILSSFVPYIFIGRIMFMYHYFITLPFMMLGIVAFIKWLTEKSKNDKIYWLYISLVIILFFVFYPVSAGTLVDDSYINALKWLSSWYF